MKTRFAFWSLYFLLWTLAAFSSGCHIVPAPWTIDRGARYDSAVERERAARLELARRAQVETLVADLALRQAPPSRPVAVAQEATAAAVSLEAAALGPVPEATRQKTTATVSALVSEDAATRAPAEAERAEAAVDNAAAAANLEKREAKTETATVKLRDGYGDERAVAGHWRRVVWGFLILLVGVILAGLFRFAREIYSRGSALSAVVAGLERFKFATPAARGALEEALRGTMDAAHKITVRRAKVSASP